MAPVFEVPVFSLAAARTAIAHGATRLELNRAGSYSVGGLTPTVEEVAAVAAVAAQANVPLRVMIRPRGPPGGSGSGGGGDPDFLYSDAEREQMRTAVVALVASGWLDAARGDGFVFGLLRHSQSQSRGDLVVDVERNRQLVAAAGPYACVFHRAFDLVVANVGDVQHALEAVCACGFSGLLTAGGPDPQGAAAHGECLRQLVEAAAAKKGLEIIVGGGVRSRGLPDLIDAVLPSFSGPRASRLCRVAFHSSCLEAAGSGETVDGAEAEAISRILLGRL